MTGYDSTSCNALQKPYYTPVEAALRWCGLIQFESKILTACADNPTVVAVTAFPQWPCLRANAEKIYDALINREIPKARDGKITTPEDHVAPARLTVRHTDLKAWMAKHYPDQKPAFLFDEIERTTHSAFNAESFRALQADRDALKARIEKAEEWARTIIAERNALVEERDSLRASLAQAGTPGERAEATYLNIIGGLLGLMLGNTPAGRPQSVFNDQTAIIAALLEHYPNRQGITKRTLESKFPAARRSLSTN